MIERHRVAAELLMLAILHCLQYSLYVFSSRSGAKRSFSAGKPGSATLR